MIVWIVQVLAALWLALIGFLAPMTLAPSHVTFVALGDSLTYGYHNPGPAWPAVLSDNGQGYYTLVHNSGVVGNTTTDMLARMPKDVFAYSPDAVFILGGVNDLGECVSVDTIEANVMSMVTLARAHGVEPVLILNPHDRSNGPTAVWPCGGQVQAGIDRLDDDLIYLAGWQNVKTIDLRPVVKPSMYVDGIHWNAAGATAVADAVRAALP